MGAAVVVVVGGGFGWVGGVVAGGGAGARVVGETAGAGALGDPEACVVGVAGCVVDVAGPAVVGAVGVDGAVGAAFEAGMPLFNTANHTFPTFCPLA
jgi:hypothetical protein